MSTNALADVLADASVGSDSLPLPPLDSDLSTQWMALSSLQTSGDIFFFWQIRHFKDLVAKITFELSLKVSLVSCCHRFCFFVLK